MKKGRRILLCAILIPLFVMMIWKTVPIGAGGWNNLQIQKISSAESSENFCFAVMGDNQDGLVTFGRIIKNINEKSMLFAIDNGDIVERGDKEKYRIFYNKILESKIPFLVNIGNHDIKDNGREDYLNIFGDFYYSFSYNNSLFVVLDNANLENVNESQMKFLESELKKDFRNKFIFIHTPPFVPGEYTMNILGFDSFIELGNSMSDKKNAQEFLDLASRYNATAVFTSHVHGYFNETIQNVPYIITGGAGGRLLLTDPEHYFYHYLNVCVKGTDISYEVVKIRSPDTDILKRLVYNLWLSTWYLIAAHRYELIIFALILFLALDVFYYQIRKAANVMRNRRIIKQKKFSAKRH